jgi:hypothetical protein
VLKVDERQWFYLVHGSVTGQVMLSDLRVVRLKESAFLKLQEHLRNLCLGCIEYHKTVAEFLCGISWNIRLNHQH